MEEKRSVSRAAVMVRVEVSWEDATGASHATIAKLEDTSPTGVSVRGPKAVPVGSRVLIKAPREQFSGIVMYCRQSRSSFLLGVQRNTAGRAEAN